MLQKSALSFEMDELDDGGDSEEDEEKFEKGKKRLGMFIMFKDGTT